MPVWIVDETGGERAARLESVAQQAAFLLLSALDHTDSELSIAFVDDDRMQELNRDWRGKDRPTDVLSFSQIEGEEMALHEEEGPLLLGDVIVSIDTLERQARDGGWTDEEELRRLLLHGLLHLLGHDHEQEEDACRMRTEEARLVGALTEAGFACAWEEDPA